jgi:hypothetical protein
VLRTHGFNILKQEERDVFTFIEARKEAVSSLSWENTATAGPK